MVMSMTGAAGSEVLWRRVAENKGTFHPSKLLREPFHLLTITLLSLLLPLSFLLLARLSCNSYFASSVAHGPFSSLLSLFLDSNPTLLLALLSLLGGATLIHCLTGGLPGGRYALHRPRLYAAWIVLCALQLCVYIGVEGSIGIVPLSLAAARDGSWVAAREGGFLGRAAFFLGLYETMLHWARIVVKPVVDDSVLGRQRDERWPERVAKALGLTGLWWWRLRDEVEALIVVPEVKMELLLGVRVADFVGWWLYYLTVTIGVVKVVKGLMWAGMILTSKWLRIRRRQEAENNGDDIIGGEDKV
ncbi:uncharacterized protein LOC116188071 [Punica granatum]|uniref:Uncharacterized protein LOC116188071 n=1 Tax=Punica granatum TaxID=22663 RepID=A0A6P8BRU7_PUNGR|nr:uncharacterized protein LOC116188071 [Punica granatum]